MGIAINEEHRELEQVARAFLTSHKARQAGRELLDAPTETMPPFWAEVADLGWLGLHLPEAHGGSGYGLEELVVVVEAFGRAVAPGPFVPTVAASAVIAACATDGQKERWLPSLADGSKTAAVGWSREITVEDGRATGRVTAVLGGALARQLVVITGDD